MFKKKLLALGLSLAMLASVVACGSDDKKENNSTNTPTQAAETTPAESGDSTPAATEAPASDEPQSAAADHSSIAAGSIVNFEDGNSSFLVLNEADWGRDADSKISIEDAFGSKMLQITRPNGLNPSIAVDIVGLLGDNASKCAKISVDIGLKNDVFGAASGSVLVYAGEDNAEVAQTYSIYKTTAACKTIEVDLGGKTLVAGNYLTLGKVTDGGAKPSSILVDNIIFYDASGNALPIDSSVSFAVEGVGEYDWSNGCKKPVDEKLFFIGTTTGGGWWPNEAETQFSFKDSSAEHYIDGTNFTFGPGDVMTVYYTLVDPNPDQPWTFFPWLVLRDWAEEDGSDSGSGICGADAGTVNLTGFDLDEDGNLDYKEDGVSPAETACLNNSFTIAQFTFDDVIAQLQKQGFTGSTAEDLAKYIDFAGFTDRGCKTNIIAVTIGKVAE